MEEIKAIWLSTQIALHRYSCKFEIMMLNLVWQKALSVCSRSSPLFLLITTEGSSSEGRHDTAAWMVENVLSNQVAMKTYQNHSSKIAHGIKLKHIQETIWLQPACHRRSLGTHRRTAKLLAHKTLEWNLWPWRHPRVPKAQHTLAPSHPRSNQTPACIETNHASHKLTTSQLLPDLRQFAAWEKEMNMFWLGNEWLNTNAFRKLSNPWRAISSEICTSWSSTLTIAKQWALTKDSKHCWPLQESGDQKFCPSVRLQQPFQARMRAERKVPWSQEHSTALLEHVVGSICPGEHHRNKSQAN